MSDKVKLTLCFEVECGDPMDALMLKRALQEHPGAPLWLKERIALALEKVVKDAHGGAWSYTVSGGVLNEKKE